MTALPTGTVTLLFTDIEGSTQRWEADRSAMSAALRRHDELLRAAIEARGGYVFKTVGDAFCAAFSLPSDGAQAAVDAQRALTKENWTGVGGLRVRMALHSGVTDERDGDYFGPTVNRVARLLGVVYGEQIVVSSVTERLLRGVLPQQTDLRDLGEHQLKDLIEPERVWQLVAPDLRDSFPPLRSLGSLPNNLPRQLTSLIGRDDVLAEIEPLVLGNPLVTLVGTGGVGKTRLALQAGADLLDGTGDGVWLVELAPVSDGAAVVDHIASTFGLRERGSQPMLDVLVEYLQDRQLLLILDNCEHLVGEVARIADAILRAALGIRLLATSREPLRIAGERVYRVPSLDPAGAIALFTERATAADAKFALTEGDTPAVAEICRRLDGIALAIELAAARVRMLPPRQLAQKLDERFRVLTGGSRTALPRQQTMRALIEWSHDLLSESEKTLFRRVSAFVGGWSLEAAEAVCSGEAPDALDVFDQLSSLVEKSLVVAEATSRYSLLESTGAFAREKLAEASELEALRLRHFTYIAGLFARAGEEHEASMAGRILDALADELENARTALDFAEHRGDIRDAVDLFVSTRLWDHLGLHREAIERAERYAVALAGDELARKARLCDVVALCRQRMGQVAEAIEAGARAVELARAAGDAGVVADALLRFGTAMSAARRFDEGSAALTESEAIPFPTPRRRYQLLAARNFIATLEGNVDEALRYQNEIRLLGRSIGNAVIEVTTAVNLAEVEYARGNTARAIEIVREQLPLASSLPDRGVQLAQLQSNLAGYLAAAGDCAGAREAAVTAIASFARRDEGGAHVAVGLGHLALIFAMEGDLRRAAVIEGYAAAALRRHGFEREHTERATYDRLAILLAGLGSEECDALCAQGALSSAAEILKLIGSI